MELKSDLSIVPNIPFTHIYVTSHISVPFKFANFPLKIPTSLHFFFFKSTCFSFATWQEIQNRLKKTNLMTKHNLLNQLLYIFPSNFFFSYNNYISHHHINNSTWNICVVPNGKRYTFIFFSISFIWKSEKKNKKPFLPKLRVFAIQIHLLTIFILINSSESNWV
jgi:hypothetical protein